MSSSADMKIQVGSKIRFLNEKKRFVVQASDDRFAICSYPLNMIHRTYDRKKYPKGYYHEKTVMYTIVDFKENVRGPENLVFGFGAETREQCEEMLARLNTPSTMRDEPTEVSHRHRVELDIENIESPK